MASAYNESGEEKELKLSSRMLTPISINEDSITYHENIDDDNVTLYQQLNLDYGAINNQQADCRQNKRAPESNGPCTLTVYCSSFVLICCLIYGLIAIIIGVIFIAYSPDVPSSVLENGDWIPPLHLISVSWAYKELSVELSSNDDYDYSSVYLYKVQCSKLRRHVEKKHDCPVRSPKNSTEANENTYFKDCSDWPGKCLIDQYVYLQEESKVAYNITVNEYSSTDNIRFLVYDDEKKFNKYLLDHGENEAVHNFNIRKKTQNVSFMISHRSYYFFVIELVQYNSKYDHHKWFKVNQSCFITSYSGVESLKPLFIIGNRYSIPLSFIDHKCIIGYYNSNSTDDLVNITWTYDKKRIDPNVLFVSGGCCLASVCFIVPIMIAFWVGLIRL